MALLDQLKTMTKVVADTGDFESIRQFSPSDATTNPSLILKAAKQEKYKHLLDKASTGYKNVGAATPSDYLVVLFGLELLKLIDGRVSTEVDARLSFDTKSTVNKARELMKLYNDHGISNDRVLIKIAATWEGIQAARILEQEGIHCNLTLLFSLCQAVSCADAGVKLISPFVGRILDWYVNQNGQIYTADNDPGVLSVKSIFHYYKHFGYNTEIMGASFRNIGEIIALAGCDLLTISPALLHELDQCEGDLKRKLDVTDAKKMDIQKVQYNESDFRFALNQDAMATEKLSSGIRAFVVDAESLQNLLN